MRARLHRSAVTEHSPWKANFGRAALAAIYVGAVLAVAGFGHLPPLAMSFASSAVLLAAQPETPAARPRALIGGHMVAALCGWACGATLGDGLLGATIAVGVAAVLMEATDTLHPPAAVSGYLMLQQPQHWTWLLFPILCNAVLLSALTRFTGAMTAKDDMSGHAIGTMSGPPPRAMNFARRRFFDVAVLAPLFALAARRGARAGDVADVLGPPGVVPLTERQPPARLIVDPPLAGPLAEGMVFIQYRAENLRIEPIFGAAALAVTPRIGHIHVVVDSAPWHWADASGEPLIIVGLPPGPHSVELILANANHQPLDRRLIALTVPETVSI